VSASAPASTRALLALLVAAAVAGCLQPSGAAGPSSSSSASGPQGSAGTTTTAAPAPASPVVELLPSFALGPCVAVSVRSAQPLDAVQALLPEGFVAAPFQSDRTAMAALDVYACGNLTTPDVRIPGALYGQAYTRILRPEGRVPGAPDAEQQEYVFRVLAAQDVLASLWPAAGYDTRNGTANVTVDAPPAAPLDPGARLGSSAVGSDYGSLADGSDRTPPGDSWSGTFARYTELADGSVLLWTGTYEVPAVFTGQGFFSVAADDRFAPFENANNVAGLARMSESASMSGMDLRRVF
jgi:hypothetical protein